MKIFNKVKIAAAVAALAALSLTGCERIREVYGNRGGLFGEAVEPEAPTFAVNTTFAAHGPIQDFLAVAGDIVADSSVDTFAETAGRISSVYVTVGQTVSQGMPIASVDPSRPGMTFRESIVAAPVSGTIVALPAQVGMTISPAVPLARISNDNGLEIRLRVAERFISRVQLNQPTEITLAAWPGEVFQGRVSEISPTIDVASRTLEVTIAISNNSARLKPGMFATVRIITERRENVVKLPASAVVSRFGEQYVFAIDRSNPEAPVVRRQIVATGIHIDGVIEIHQGLSPNDEVVIRGQSLLSDGSRVNVIEQVAPIGIGA
ncbi:MAG: efflux RND transporter periplasmic adaptor subunit [Spirochaetes bacterium]|nr:efflux RND transporter periplasmic adaptor subunit [Spirochaetota bacterium]